jgi:DNA polymerase-3 subunit gamma/tau
MAYIVLARKWRPQQFEDIIGQDHVSTTLANAIETGRIAHSFIFAGPRGVGKTTAARILAKALNCEKGPTKTPCNACSSCESITKGNSLDVLEIDGASNRGIDEIRNLRENIRFTPSQGKYRIYIIDEVHMLTKEAFNALLKTLEEPPKHAIFIFATTEIHRVPATILSRCQRFDFKRIPTKTIIGHLKKICEKEKISISEDALLQIAKKADGSMRDGQSILDQIISYSGGKISSEEVASALGIIDQEIFFQFTEKIKNGDLKEILNLCQTIYREGYDLAEFLLGFEEHLRNLLVTKTIGNTELLNVSEQFAESYQKDSQDFQETDLLRYIQQIGDLQNSLKWATQAQMKFEIGLLKLAKMPTTESIENILEKLNLLKKKSNTTVEAPKSESPPVDKSHSTPPPLDLNEVKSYWTTLIEEFRNSKVNLANALELGEPVELNKTDLFLEYAKQNSFHITWFKKHQRTIETHLYEHFQEPIKITVQVVEGESDAQESNPDKPLDKSSATKLIKDDPLLNKLVEELGLELT